MGALEEPHLVAAACACEEEEEDDLELLAGEGEAAAADAIEPAVRALLLGLGEDERREGLRRTPRRVAKAFRDGTRGTAHVPASLLPAPHARREFVDLIWCTIILRLPFSSSLPPYLPRGSSVRHQAW
jgi:hypothetical protein